MNVNKSKESVLNWIVVVIIAIAAFFMIRSGEAAELVIVHPGSQETLRGEIVELHPGYVDFHYCFYESWSFDTIMADGFDERPGSDLRKWNVVLEYSPTDVAFFTYTCSSYLYENGSDSQLVLYCVN